MARLKKNIHLLNKQWTETKVNDEIQRGLDLLNDVDSKIVTILGSHISGPKTNDYKHCTELCSKLSKDGYAIVTGGGPGIMEAANKAAVMAGGSSVGIRAGLIKNEKVEGSPYTHLESFDFLFVRRFILSVKSEALIFYPGAYGTLNELFEYVVLVETGLVDKVPLICVGKEFWAGMFKWMREQPAKRGMFPNGVKDLKMIHVVDDISKIVKIIESK